MKCFDCSNNGRVADAVGVCHHCSAGVCSQDGTLVADPVTMQALILKEIVLPKKARVLLCHTCLAALTQSHRTDA
jgi:hypothetical protein